MEVDFIPSGEDFSEDFFLVVFGEFEEGLADLFGEFSGGGEDEALNFGEIGIYFGEEGESECGGLARAGLGLGDEVISFLEKVGDRLCLNRSGLADS